MDDLSGQIESYFDILGSIGREIVATDAEGSRLATVEAITGLLTEVQQTKRARKHIFFIGNGGSAGISSHMATDWMKNGGFHALSLSDGAVLTCLANDLGYDQVFSKQIEMHANSGDLLIAISSSGNSRNILNAVAAARRLDAAIVTLSGFQPDNKLRQLGDINFYVPNRSYGFVEIAHLAICHAALDLAMGWRSSDSSAFAPIEVE